MPRAKKVSYGLSPEEVRRVKTMYITHRDARLGMGEKVDFRALMKETILLVVDLRPSHVAMVERINEEKRESGHGPRRRKPRPGLLALEA
jgi:hypothetical protein